MSRRKSGFTYELGSDLTSGLLHGGGRKRNARRGNRYFPITIVKYIASFVVVISTIAFISPKVFANPFKSVQVTDGYGEYTLLTKADTVGELYQSGVLRLSSGDTGQAASHESVASGMEVAVDRAINVTVKTKNENISVRMKKGTVKEALDMANIDYSETDEVSPSFDQVLNNGDSVAFAQIDNSSVTKKQSIAFKTVEVEDSSLPQGQRKVLTEGSNGSKNITYNITFKDGVEVARKVSGEKIIDNPVNRKIAVGTGKVNNDNNNQNSNNNNNAGNNNNSNNNNNNAAKPPIHVPPELDAGRVAYAKVMMVTAYSPENSPNPTTSTGKAPRIGTIAVNTSEFPYGTGFYVPGYGYGTAEDTGGMGSNTIDVWYPTQAQCTIWGRKTITVYVLK